jgi:hypothetical protein
MRRLSFETLEDRRVLATVTVSNTNDFVNGNVDSGIPALISSPGIDGISLREAILAANSGDGFDTIQFDSSLNGLTINLNPNNPSLLITDPVDIFGPANNITIRPQSTPTIEMYGLLYSFVTGTSASLAAYRLNFTGDFKDQLQHNRLASFSAGDR